MDVGSIEVALGRDLTWLERQWATHTAGWTPNQLFCLTFVYLLAVVLLGNAPYALLDLWRPAFSEKYRLQVASEAEAQRTPASLFRVFRDVLLLFLVVVLPLQLTSFPVFNIAGIRTGYPLPTGWEILLHLVICFIVEDYGNYWIHRWMHSPWLYNKIHYMHHEYTAPVSMCASYAHPIEIIALGLPTFAGPALLGCHLITLWLWIPLRALEATETHSGYDFPWTFTKLIPFYGGAEHHDYHHFVGGTSRNNFASVFTYCDWLYGTDKASCCSIGLSYCTGYRAYKSLVKKQKVQPVSADLGEHGINGTAHLHAKEQ
eukprot:jgi/Chlat1/8106/Chrsp75S07556